MCEYIKTGMNSKEEREIKDTATLNEIVDAVMLNQKKMIFVIYVEAGLRYRLQRGFRHLGAESVSPSLLTADEPEIDPGRFEELAAAKYLTVLDFDEFSDLKGARLKEIVHGELFLQLIWSSRMFICNQARTKKLVILADQERPVPSILDTEGGLKARTEVIYVNDPYYNEDSVPVMHEIFLK